VTFGDAEPSGSHAVRRIHGIVVMLDALGMKGVWARREPAQVVNAWLGLVQRLEQAVAAVAQANASICGDYGVAAFSDTLILTIESKAQGTSLEELLQLTGDVLLEPFLIGLFEGIFLRGVIAKGDYYQSRSTNRPESASLLTIGPAIDEAAEWYDQSDWIGVSTVPSASFVLDEAHDLGRPASTSLVSHDVPLRSGTELRAWALDWPGGVWENRGPVARAALLSVFAANPIPPVAVSKYRHSLAFFDRRLEVLAVAEPSPS
jgi:hypothetical protein